MFNIILLSYKDKLSFQFQTSKGKNLKKIIFE